MHRFEASKHACTYVCAHVHLYPLHRCGLASTYAINEATRAVRGSAAQASVPSSPAAAATTGDADAAAGAAAAAPFASGMGCSVPDHDRTRWGLCDTYSSWRHTVYHTHAHAHAYAWYRYEHAANAKRYTDMDRVHISFAFVDLCSCVCVCLWLDMYTGLCPNACSQRGVCSRGRFFKAGYDDSTYGCICAGTSRSAPFFSATRRNGKAGLP